MTRRGRAEREREAGVATMRDVAERANVSIATVSFVVNQTKRVSPETRARILVAMEELGFQRNAMARALASRKSRILALLFPALEHRLGSFVTSAAKAAEERGYKLVLWPVRNDGADEVTELISGGLADGVLLMEVQLDDPRVDRLVDAGAPFALIGRNRDPSKLSYVDMDFEKTVELGIDYLFDLGHRNIALVLEEFEGTPLAGYAPPVRTEERYREHMAELGLETVVLTCAQNPVAGRQLAADLLVAAPDTTAIIIMNAEASFGLVNGLAHAGLKIPADISVLAMATTSDVSAFSDPMLTTMDAPSAEMGRRAIDALLAQIEGGSAELQQELLVCELHIADSTGPVSERQRTVRS
jgi:DNA-binding LacI/PurR family transcriptional regulator